MIYLSSVEMTVMSKLNYMTSSISQRCFRSKLLLGGSYLLVFLCEVGYYIETSACQSMTLLWALYSACYSVKVFHLFSLILAESSFFSIGGRERLAQEGRNEIAKRTCIPEI